MGDDPDGSVVDQWCMAHDIPNLGIIDGSVFVTAGAVNPTSTICALALRAADHLIRHRAALPTPAVTHAPKPHPPPVAPLPARSPEHPLAKPDPGLSALQQARLVQVADALIPAVDHLPAAGAMIDALALARLFGVRADLAAELRRLLAVPISDPVAFVQDLADRDPAGREALLTAIAGIYFLEPQVRARIGYDGQVALPRSPDRYPVYLANGLLDHSAVPSLLSLAIAVAGLDQGAWGAFGSCPGFENYPSHSTDRCLTRFI